MSPKMSTLQGPSVVLSPIPGACPSLYASGQPRQATASLSPSPYYMLQFEQDFACQLNAFPVHTFHSHKVTLGEEERCSRLPWEHQVLAEAYPHSLPSEHDAPAPGPEDPGHP